MNGFSVAALIAFLLGALMFLVQLWTDCWSAEFFVKLMITDGVLTVVLAIVAFLVKEKQDNDKLSKGDDLL